MVKCIIYAGSTDTYTKLLAWDHNTYSEYGISMTFIQRTRFIHNEFEELCGRDKSKVDTPFRKQCCMEIEFPSSEGKASQKCVKESDLFRGMDNYFQLGFKIGHTCDIIDEIFILWENVGIKNQKIKKNKNLVSNIGKTSPKMKNMPEDMTITPWKSMQGIKDERVVMSI